MEILTGYTYGDSVTQYYSNPIQTKFEWGLSPDKNKSIDYGNLNGHVFIFG